MSRSGHRAAEGMNDRYRRMLVFSALCLSLVTAGCNKALAPLPGHAIRTGRYVPDDNVKEYREKDPKGYANHVWWSIVTAQQTLARFGYGTRPVNKGARALPSTTPVKDGELKASPNVSAVGVACVAG